MDVGRVIGHELGHYLGLRHAEERFVRVSSWALGRLMFNALTVTVEALADWQIPAMPPGDGGTRVVTGTLLTRKALNDPAESEPATPPAGDPYFAQCGSPTDAPGDATANDDQEASRLRAADVYDGVELPAAGWFG